jgi:hypothetical protein
LKILQLIHEQPYQELHQDIRLFRSIPDLIQLHSSLLFASIKCKAALSDGKYKTDRKVSYKEEQTSNITPSRNLRLNFLRNFLFLVVGLVLLLAEGLNNTVVIKYQKIHKMQIHPSNLKKSF